VCVWLAKVVHKVLAATNRECVRNGEHRRGGERGDGERTLLVSVAGWWMSVAGFSFLISNKTTFNSCWQKKRRDVDQAEQEWAKTRNQVTAKEKGLCNKTEFATSKLHYICVL